MNTIKKCLCGISLVLFLMCLVQIRRYEPEIVKYFHRGGAAPERAEESRADVVIDPGHGGMDGGTPGGGVLEKHWTLLMGRELARELRSRGLEVVMTREEDEAISLEQRCRIANTSGAKAFVSIHFNYSHEPSVSGFESYFSWPKSLAATQALRRSLGVGSGVGFKDQRGEMLARAIQQSVVENTGIRNRGARNSQLWVTRNTSLPAVLLECGFLSNQKEKQDYTNPRYRQQVTGAVADALEEFLRANGESQMMGVEFE